jgi:signal transduction histidine kinase
MSPSKLPGTYRYAFVATAIIVITGAVFGILQHLQIQRDLNTVNERNNIFLAHAFANLVWPDIRAFVAAAGTLPPESLKSHPKVIETQARARDFARNVPLLKIKVFDLDGLTVFSTDPSQIGDDKATYPGFVSARKGTVASNLDQRDSFDGINGRVYDRRVLSSYIPVVNAAGKTEGVFEIYTDVTESIAQARNSAMLQFAFVGLVFILLFEVGLNLIRLRDKAIAESHAKQLELTEIAVAAEEANRTKSALLANMSHELRTPLNAVIGFSETMRLQPFGPIGSPKYLTYVNDIWNSGRRLLAIVDNVLEMARIDNGSAKLQITGVDVPELISWAVRHVEATEPGSGVPMRIHDIREPLTVLIDEKRMRQVLAQLLSNARKFTPPHGSIEIAARRNRSGDLEITITDTGIGMAPEDVEAALLPFSKMDTPYQNRSDGARLGLPLARMLMELHGGTLAIESVLGKGTSVVAVLPSHCIDVDSAPRLRTDYRPDAAHGRPYSA